MPDSRTLLLFLAATLTLNVTPGPDMLYVVARATSGGHRSGAIAALGIAGGIALHIAAVALGVTAVLAAVPIAYNAVRWAGAAYLGWLGVNALRPAQQNPGAVAVLPARSNVVFWQGVLTSALNPKIAIFFLALLPQFVDAHRGPVGPQFLVLGLMFVASGTTVNLIVALAARRAVAWFDRRGPRTAQRAATSIRRATGLLFLGLGVRLAVERGR